MAEDSTHITGAIAGIFLLNRFGIYTIGSDFIQLLLIGLGLFVAGNLFYEFFMGGVAKQAAYSALSGYAAFMLLTSYAQFNVLAPLLIGISAYCGARCIIDFVDEKLLMVVPDTARRILISGGLVALVVALATKVI